MKQINRSGNPRKIDGAYEAVDNAHRELLRIRPRELGELLDGNPATAVLALEAALVDDVGGLLSALGDYVLGAEVVGGHPELREGELAEGPGAAGISAVRGRRRKLVVVVAVAIALVVPPVRRVVTLQRGRLAAAHNSTPPEFTQLV